MRVSLLLLLLVVCVNGGILSGIGKNVKNFLGGGGSLAQKLKNATVTGFQKVLNVTKLKIREKFDKIKEKVKKTLELTPKMMASLKEKLAKLRTIKFVKVNEAGDSIPEVNQNSHVAEHLFQSDMLLTDEQLDEIVNDVEVQVSGQRNKRQAFKDFRYPNTTWAGGVNYHFDYTATPKIQSVFKKAVELWRKDTCINFKEDDKANSRIRVFRENGCWSYVGRLNKPQDLSLGKGCETVGTAAHELGHALGFYHTMSRHDRDDFIFVDYGNMQATVRDQFIKQTTKTNDNYNITYDYGSIMHYAGTAGSWNAKPVLVPKDTDYQETLGSRFIAFYDLLMINKHYGCLEHCEKAANKATCDNGGVPHPRDCSTCLCPNGYAGPLCKDRPIIKGCGFTLNATKTYQNITEVLGYENKPEEEDFDLCYYWVESPEGTQIEVRVDAIDDVLTVDGCPYAGVEIKAQEDQKASGYRFCSDADVDRTVVSKSNRVPIMFFSREGRSIFKLQYRYVTDGKPGPKPTKPPSAVTKRPFNTPPGFVCKDTPFCATLLKSDICDSSYFPEYMKWKNCPQACNYC